MKAQYGYFYNSICKSKFQETSQQQLNKFLISWIHLISMYITGCLRALYVYDEYLEAFDLVNSQASCLADLLKVDAFVRVRLACHPGGHLLLDQVVTSWSRWSPATEELTPSPPDRINTWRGANFLQGRRKTGKVGRTVIQQNGGLSG